MEGLTERIMNNTLTEEDKKIILKVMKDYMIQKEYENKAIENNKETVFGK